MTAKKKKIVPISSIPQFVDESSVTMQECTIVAAKRGAILLENTQGQRVIISHSIMQHLADYWFDQLEDDCVKIEELKENAGGLN